jgi:hypothetical protein
VLFRSHSFALLLASLCSTANPFPGGQNTESFVPIKHWRKAVLTGDVASLKSFYSVARPLREMPPSLKTADDNVNFWTQWKTRGLMDLSLEISSQRREQDALILIIQAELTVSEKAGLRKYCVVIGQGWVRQGGDWLIGTVDRGKVMRLRIPAERLHLYPEGADARGDIAKAVRAARLLHKRILLMFGNNTCTNCDVLEEAFKDPEIAPTFNQFYELAHINIGGLDKNLDVAKQYGCPASERFSSQGGT